MSTLLGSFDQGPSLSVWSGFQTFILCPGSLVQAVLTSFENQKQEQPVKWSLRLCGEGAGVGLQILIFLICVFTCENLLVSGYLHFSVCVLYVSKHFIFVKVSEFRGCCSHEGFPSAFGAFCYPYYFLIFILFIYFFVS